MFTRRRRRDNPDEQTVHEHRKRELEILTEAIGEHRHYHGTLNNQIGISLSSLVALVASYCSGQWRLIRPFEQLLFLACLATVILAIVVYLAQKEVYPRSRAQVYRDIQQSHLDVAREYFLRLETITADKKLSFRLIAGFTAVDWAVFIVGHLFS